MRDLIVTENISLDGVIDSGEDWSVGPDSDNPAGNDELLQVQRQHMADADAVLLGRITFEEFRGYWPKQTNDTTGIAEYLNRTHKYVVSSTLTKPNWQNTTILSGSIRAEVAALKARKGKAIVSTGSVKLVRLLIRAGLVDEYRLFVYPLVYGRGRRLFERTRGVPPLRLVETRPFGSGIVLHRYRVPPTVATPVAAVT